MLRRTTFLAYAVLGGTAVAAPVMHAESGRERARATPGVACVQIAEEDGTPRGECSGRRYPLETRGTVTLKRGGRVDLVFSKGPSSVKWRILRRGEANPTTVLSGEANRAPGDHRRFIVKLPRRIPCGRVMDVYGVYGRGDDKTDQVWWVGVRSPGCPKPKKKKR